MIVVEEVTRRTPGYNSWQQEEWQSHCGDACEFHGDATKSEIAALKDNDLSGFLKNQMIKPKVWNQILDGYQAGGNPAIYKFVCHQCRKISYTMDFT